MSFILLSASLYAADEAKFHDLTKGDKAGKTDFNVGPTGFRGWVDHHPHRTIPDTSMSRQILVTEIAEGSPADGKLQVGDVILGADGSGANGAVPLFDSNARISIAGAIADAEARNPAALKMQVWRKGKTGEVTITLKTIGAYSDTAPYDCEKSRNILRQGLEVVYENASKGEGGYAGLNALILMAGDDPTNPNNEKYQAKAKEIVYSLILDEKEIEKHKNVEGMLNVGKLAWPVGYKLIVVGEYYLKTKDPAVFKTLEALAICFAKGQDSEGKVSHYFAPRNKDGSLHGPLLGYGAINGAGVAGFLGLVLAQEAGVQHAEVQAGINRAANFFSRYTYKSMIPYGGGDPVPKYGYENNGKNATAALAFMNLPGRAEDARFCAKMSMNAIDPVRNRLMSHAGPYFNYVWPALGAAVLGPEAAHYYLSHYYWHYDISRRWDGSVEYDCFGAYKAAYNTFPSELTTLLTYALPLRNLYITGRDPDRSLWLSKEEFKESCSANFNANTASVEALIAKMDSWDPILRLGIAGVLASRFNEMPEGEQTSLFARLKKLILDPNTSWRVREVVARALNGIRHPDKIDLLIQATGDVDPHVSFCAAESLKQSFPRLSHEQLTTVLSRMIEGKGYQSMASMLMLNNGALMKGIPEGFDRELVWKTLRSRPGVGFPMIHLLDHMTDEEALENADIIVSSAMNDDMKATSVLQERGFAEGVPLAINLARNPNHHYYNSGYKTIQAYGAASLKVEPNHEVLQFLYECNFQPDSIVCIFTILKSIDAVVKDKDPKPLRYLKKITSVSADHASISLPERATTMHVNARNYAFRNPKDTLYTWSKLDGPGEVSFAPNGTWNSKDTKVEFTGAEPGVYRFKVTMSDIHGLSEIHDTVTVTLNQNNGKLPSNKPPKATPLTLAAISGTPISVVLAGTDPENKPMSYHLVSQPAHGRISGDAPKLIYIAHFGYEGSDSFDFKVVDSNGESDTATVQITVVDKPRPVTVFEPFDYPEGTYTLKPGDVKPGTSGFGLTGDIKAVFAGKGGFAPFSVKGYSRGFANLPTAGAAMFTDKGLVGYERELDRAALDRDNLLADGGQLFLSVIVENKGYHINAGGIEVGLVGDGVSVGMKKTGVSKNAKGLKTIVGEVEGSGGLTAQTPIDMPSMFVLRCRWGKTPEAVDVIELFRVYEGPDGQPDPFRQPVSRQEAVIDQQKLNALRVLSGACVVDDIRIGTSLLSVLRGTVPTAGNK